MESMILGVCTDEQLPQDAIATGPELLKSLPGVVCQAAGTHGGMDGLDAIAFGILVRI